MPREARIILVIVLIFHATQLTVGRKVNRIQFNL